MSKKILTILLLLCAVLTGMAQRYNRDAFTFKSSLVMNAEEENIRITVKAYVGGKVVQEFTTETGGIPEETTIDDVGTITEEDLNGDNIPDVCIDLGYYGHRPNDHYFDALIWDQERGLFVQAEGYSDLPEPMIDEKTGLLYTVGHLSPDEMQTDYYAWQGHKVIFHHSKAWRIDGNPALPEELANDLEGYDQCALVTVGQIPVLWLSSDSDRDLLINLADGTDDKDRVLLASDYAGIYEVRFYEHGASLHVSTGDYTYDDVYVVLDGKTVVHRYEEGATGTGGAATGYCKLDGEDNYSITEEQLRQWLGEEVTVTPEWQNFDGDLNQYLIQ